MKIYLAGAHIIDGGEKYKKIYDLFKLGHKLHSFYHCEEEKGFERKWFKVNIKNKVNLFLDSGAHSLYTKYMIKTNHKYGYD